MSKADIVFRIDADVAQAASALREVELDLILDSVFAGENSCGHREGDDWVRLTYVPAPHEVHPTGLGIYQCGCGDSQCADGISDFVTWYDHPVGPLAAELIEQMQESDFDAQATIQSIREYHIDQAEYFVELFSDPARVEDWIAHHGAPEGSLYGWTLVRDYWQEFIAAIEAGTIPSRFDVWLFLREESVDILS